MKRIILLLTLVFLLIGIRVFAGEGDFIVNGKLGLGTTNPAGIFEIAGLVNISASNAIPTMTSNTTPSGVASADSSYNSNYSAWKAMDRSNSGYLCWLTGTGGTFPHWLQYRFASGKIITSYSVTSPNYPNWVVSPKTWKLQGSNNGSSWTDLDTQTNQSFSISSNEKKT